MFTDFDRYGLSAEERRHAIRARHGVEVAGQGKDRRVREAGAVPSPRRRPPIG